MRDNTVHFLAAEAGALLAVDGVDGQAVHQDGVPVAGRGQVGGLTRDEVQMKMRDALPRLDAFLDGPIEGAAMEGFQEDLHRFAGKEHHLRGFGVGQVKQAFDMALGQDQGMARQDGGEVVDRPEMVIFAEGGGFDGGGAEGTCRLKRFFLHMDIILPYHEGSGQCSVFSEQSAPAIGTGKHRLIYN